MQINIEKKNSYTEDVSVINSLPESDINKIPPQLITAFEKNQNKDYNFTFNPNCSFEQSKFNAKNTINFSRHF